MLCWLVSDGPVLLGHNYLTHFMKDTYWDVWSPRSEHSGVLRLHLVNKRFQILNSLKLFIVNFNVCSYFFTRAHLTEWLFLIFLCTVWEVAVNILSVRLWQVFCSWHRNNEDKYSYILQSTNLKVFGQFLVCASVCMSQSDLFIKFTL